MAQQKSGPKIPFRFVQIFSWWSSLTIGTRLWTSRFGQFVGTDEFGNHYYRTGKIDPDLHFERRWVIYSGESDGSLTPPGWYGWLHHTSDVAPTEESYAAREWQKPHLPNMTGTPDAYRPEGSVLRSGQRQKTGADYGAWTPN